MNRLVLPALMCLVNGVCQSAPSTDIRAITITIQNRLNNNAFPLQKELVTQLRQQRKDTDSTELATCKKAQKAAQSSCNSAKKEAQAACDEQKKKLYSSYNEEKARRRTHFKQVVQSLRSAKKQTKASAATLRSLLSQTHAYLELLEREAQDTKDKRLVRRAHAEQTWLNTLQTTLKRSDVSLDTPINKEKKPLLKK